MKTQAIAVLMLLLSMFTHAQQGINLLSSEIYLQPDSICKAALLDSISKKLNIHFSYNPEQIDARSKIKLNQPKNTLIDLLNQLIDPETTGFHLLDNQIVIYPLKAEEDVAKKEEPYLIIRGSVSDKKEKEPIPFCNIAIVGKSMGTMSNNDGVFLFKVPSSLNTDTLRFSCMGYSPFDIPIKSATDTILDIGLEKTVINLKTIDIVHYQPAVLLQKFFDNLDKNYEDEYTLLSTFYREMILENKNYTDVSEAVLNVLKAPYSNDIRDDLVKFVMGRKSTNVRPFDDIRFRLKGGPYYITKLDVVKNRESFINPEFISLFQYEFERNTVIAGRETAIVSFVPVYNLRDMLFAGMLYFDVETGAIARVEFNYTRQGLKEARRMMIEKEPRDYKAIPADLSYRVEYRFINGKWYLLSARSSMEVKIVDKSKRQKTNFHSISEILVTNIEKGDLVHFGRKDIFRPNDFFTEKITQYDESFWQNYNVIEPEEELESALKNFDERNLIISNK